MAALQNKRYSNDFNKILVKKIPEGWDRHMIKDFIERGSEIDVVYVNLFENVKTVALVEFEEQINTDEFETIVAKGQEKRWKNIEMYFITKCDGLLVSNVPPGISEFEVRNFLTKSRKFNIDKIRRYKSKYVVLYITDQNVIKKLRERCSGLPEEMNMEMFFEPFHTEVFKQLPDTSKPHPVTASSISHSNDDDTDDDEDDDVDDDAEDDDDDDDEDDDGDHHNVSEDSVESEDDETERSSPKASNKSSDASNKSSQASNKSSQASNKSQNNSDNQDRNSRVDIDIRKPVPPPTQPKPKLITWQYKMVDHIKFKLLKTCNFADGCSMCKFKFNDTEKEVELVGTQANLNNAKVYMFEKLGTFHEERSEKLSKAFLHIFRSVNGKVYLDSIFGTQTDVIGYVSDDGDLVCSSFNPSLAKNLMKICHSFMMKNQLVLKKAYQPFVRGPTSTWMNVKRDLEERYLIQIDASNDELIIIEGVEGDVKTSMDELREILERNQHAEKVLMFKGETGICMSRYCTTRLNALKDEMRNGHGIMKDQLMDDGYQIELSGTPGAVQQVDNDLQKLKKSVWHLKLSFKEDMKLSGRELNLLIKGLKNTNQSILKATFEYGHTCCLEFQNLKPQQPSHIDFERSLSISPPQSEKRPKLRLPNVLKKKMSMPSLQTAKMVPMADSGQLYSVTFGQATVSIRQGDITKEKTDVLVNVLRTTGNIKHTAIGQAFSTVGGPALDAALQTYLTENGISDDGKLSPGTVIITPGGKLTAVIHHVVLDRWNPQTSIKILESIIKDVLLKMHKAGKTSVSFPSLGCGKLYKFPPDKMASTCLNALQTELKNYPKIKSVYFVIYDDDVCDDFKTEMRRFGVPSPSLKDASDDSSDSGGDNLVDYMYIAKTFKQDEREMDGSDNACLRLYAPCKDVCKNVKSMLIKHLKDHYLSKDIIEADAITQLSRRTLDEIKSQADRSNVSIYYKAPDKKDLKKSGTLKLQGEKEAVSKVKMTIQDILLKQTEPELKLPRYWKHSKSLIKNAIKMKKDNLVVIDNKSPLYASIVDIVNKTWMVDHVGKGRDAVGLQHSKIEITQIDRLENEILYRKYCDKRKDLFGKVQRNEAINLNIAQIPDSKGPVLTTKIARPELQREIHSEVNEHYLFHGTHLENLPDILVNGLDSRLSGQSGMLGSAIYMAESATKADQYADPKRSRTVGPKKILMCKVLLGSTFLCTDATDSTKYKRPPCMNKAHNYSSQCKEGHDMFDSVMADGVWIFREFAVYEPSMVYPEYIITYNRVIAQK